MDISDMLLRIDALLVQKGMKKEEFYESVPITSSAISQWRTGRACPSKKKIERIAEILGVTPEYIEYGVAGSRNDGNSHKNYLYARIENLCIDRGISIAEMCKNIGIPAKTITSLNSKREKGLLPEIVDKMASFFAVSPDYIALGKTEKAPTFQSGGSIDDMLGDMTNSELIELIAKATERLRRN